MRKIFIAILFLCIAWNHVLCKVHTGNYTLLIYMNGSNLESKNKLASADIEEMKSSFKPDSLNRFTILLLMGGTQTWHTQETLCVPISNDSITYATVTDKGIQKIRTVEDTGIGTPETLTEFINFAKSSYPAKDYGLIFWNHGAGSVSGFGYDELHPDNTSLTVKEMQQGLKSAYALHPQKFSFIGFDACLMASIETASAIAPFADYMIASQELEPGEGWNYRSIIPLLQNASDTTSEILYKGMVDSYIEYYKNEEAKSVTLSALRLNRINDLSNVFSQFFQQKHEQLVDKSGTIQSDSYQAISNARANTKSFGMPSFTFYGTDMVDVLDLCKNNADSCNQTLLETLHATLSETVIHNRVTNILANENACGLSVYFPYYNIHTANHLESYYQCGFNNEYLDFVRSFTNELLSGNKGKGSITFDDMDATELLPTDIILNTRKIYATVLAETTDKKWISYGLDGDGVSLNEQGKIIKVNSRKEETEKWDKRWISIGGKIVSAYMTFSGKDALNYTVPVYLNGELSDLIITYDQQNPSGKVQGARRILNEYIPDKGITPIKKNDKIVFLSKEFDCENNSETTYTATDSIVALKKKHLKVNLTKVPKGIYKYGYCLIDLYGNKHYTGFELYKNE